MLRLTATPDLSGAACIGHDPDIFTPDNPKRPDPEALDACGSCPVAQTCLTWGIDAGETGIYGGQSLTKGRIVKPAVHPPRPDRQKATCRDCKAPTAGPTHWYCDGCRVEHRRATWRKNSNDGQPKPRVCRHCGVAVAFRRSVCDSCRRERRAAHGRARRAARKALLPPTPPALPLSVALLDAEVRSFHAAHPGASRTRWRATLPVPAMSREAG